MVTIDKIRNQVCSRSTDGSIRIWDLDTGACKLILRGHTSLVGLLGASPSQLVSACADATLRVWNAKTGDIRHTLIGHPGAITCFQHDEFKVASGSDGALKLWNIQDGTLICDLTSEWCVAAFARLGTTFLEGWDFWKEGDGLWIEEHADGVYDVDDRMIKPDANDDELGTPRIKRLFKLRDQTARVVVTA